MPGHLGLAEEGHRLSDSEPGCGQAALKVFTASAAQISPIAYRIQGYSDSRIIFNAVISRLGQAVSGETTLEDAYKRIAADVAQQIAERNKK